MKPTEAAYWNRPSEEVAHDVVGERLLTHDRMIIVTRAEAFRSLKRPAMQEDFGDGERHPGDVYMTSTRGFPLVNVTARTDADKPEVVWLKTMVEEGETVSGKNLVTSIAEQMKRKVDGKGLLMQFAMRELDGKSVLEAASPIRIIPNVDMPLDKRGISFNKSGGTAANSVGVASLTDDVNGITTIEQAREILASEALRLNVPLADLLDPVKINGYMKKSPLLRKVWRFFQGE